MSWNMYKNEAGLNTYENFKAEPHEVFQVLRFIKSKFENRLKFTKEFLSIITDDVYNDIEIDGVKIHIGWDNWSGLFIMAWDNNGNKIIEEIAVLIREEDLLPN